MVDFIVIFRDSVMTALFAWGGVSAEPSAAPPGLEAAPMGLEQPALNQPALNEPAPLAPPRLTR